MESETKYKVYTKGWYPDIKTVCHTDWLTLDQCRKFIQDSEDLTNIPLTTIHLISQDYQTRFFTTIEFAQSKKEIK